MSIALALAAIMIAGCSPQLVSRLTGRLRLKSRNVIVLPGESFFFGLEGDWAHSRECVRVNYSGSEELFARGLRIMAEELRRIYER